MTNIQIFSAIGTQEFDSLFCELWVNNGMLHDHKISSVYEGCRHLPSKLCQPIDVVC